jgi:hypothetical protein
MPARKNPSLKNSTAANFAKMISELQLQRREAVAKIDEIDSTFKRFGITAQTGRRKPGPKKKGPSAKSLKTMAKGATGARKKAKPSKKDKVTNVAAKAKGRTRRSFPTTGEEFILGHVKTQGNATTEQIRTAWAKAGRGGKPENHLTNLVKAGKLLRMNPMGQRRSVYSLGATAAGLESRPSA